MSDPSHLRSIEAVPELLENAILVREEKDLKGREKDILAQYAFIAPTFRGEQAPSSETRCQGDKRGKEIL